MTWVSNDFLTPKRFEPRLPFFNKSKYGNFNFLEENLNFYLHWFSWYSTPNMALRKIILTFFLPKMRTMRSASLNFSKLLSNRNEFLQKCSGVNIVVPGTFWVHSVQGFGSQGTSKWKNTIHVISGRILKYWDFFMNYILLSRNGSTRARNFILSWLEWQSRMVDPTCEIFYYDVIVVKERL